MHPVSTLPETRDKFFKNETISEQRDGNPKLLRNTDQVRRYPSSGPVRDATTSN